MPTPAKKETTPIMDILDRHRAEIKDKTGQELFVGYYGSGRF